MSRESSEIFKFVMKTHAKKQNNDVNEPDVYLVVLSYNGTPSLLASSGAMAMEQASTISPISGPYYCWKYIESEVEADKLRSRLTCVDKATPILQSPDHIKTHRYVLMRFSPYIRLPSLIVYRSHQGNNPEENEQGSRHY